jgi:hypothetical protein
MKSIVSLLPVIAEMFLICMVSQGICPGNRLRLLAGVYDTGQLLTDSPELLELNTLQRQGKRRSWHVQPNKVSFTLSDGDAVPSFQAQNVFSGYI